MENLSLRPFKISEYGSRTRRVVFCFSNHEAPGLCKLAVCLLRLRGSVSRQHQGKLVQSAWLQLTDVFDLLEAKHEGTICRHLIGPWW